MTILVISIIIFILILASGYAGLHMQKRLADEHKTDQSRGVVGQVAGLVSLLLALVLGTLIGVSFAYFSTQKTELEGFSAQILRLDQALAQYGPETKPARDKLKAGIVKGYETFWGGTETDPNLLSAAVPLASAQAMSDFLATLQPKTDAQKQALATANQYNSGRAIAAADVAASRESAGIVGAHRDSVVLDGRAVFRHWPFRREQLASGFGAGIRGAVDRLRDLPYPRTRPAVHRLDARFAGRARAGDRNRRQVGGGRRSRASPACWISSNQRRVP